MPVEVIDRHQVDAAPPGKRCAKPDSDQQSPDQPGSGRDRHQIRRPTRAPWGMSKTVYSFPEAMCSLMKQWSLRWRAISPLGIATT